VPLNAAWPESCVITAAVTPSSCVLRLLTMPKIPEKPSWVDALEESLLLAIGLFTLITWIFTIGLLAH